MAVQVDALQARVAIPDALQAVWRFARAHTLLTLLVLNLAATVMVYVPLYEHQPESNRILLTFSGLSLDNIYRYFDGPLYLIIAKTFYGAGSPELLTYGHLTPEYYAAHFPGYPLTIRAFSYVFGYPIGMLAATFAATSLAIWVFHLLLKDLGLGQKALWLGAVFLVLPPRWLIYHSVGASEPLFILTFLAFILFFRREQYWLAGLAGGAAVLTRSPGILLLLAALLITGWQYYRATPRRPVLDVVRRQLLPMWPFAAVPLGIFLFYAQPGQYGDFMAYFHSPGDNIHLTGAPFASLWPSILGTNWSEATLWIYLLNAVGIIFLWNSGKRDLAIFAGVLYLPLVFVGHHDLVRYMMPIFPLGLIIAFERLISAKEFKLAMLVIVPAIYIYTWSGVQTNLAPEEPTRQLLDALK